MKAIQVSIDEALLAQLDADTEVLVGIDEGLKHDSAINLDHLQTVDRTRLKQFLGSVPAGKMQLVC